jgi:hypothetical protein
MQTLKSGSINDRKSEPSLRPCPKFVVDAAVGTQKKNVQVCARNKLAWFCDGRNTGTASLYIVSCSLLRTSTLSHKCMLAHNGTA